MPQRHEEVEASEVRRRWAVQQVAERRRRAYGEGLRQGETLGLGWQDVDLENRLLRVWRALQRQPDGSLALVGTKTDRSTASMLLAQGVAARVVMEILGHSQISVTMNTYTHVDPELNRVAIDRMEDLLWATD